MYDYHCKIAHRNYIKFSYTIEIIKCHAQYRNDYTFITSNYFYNFKRRCCSLSGRLPASVSKNYFKNASALFINGMQVCTEISK